MGNKGYVNLDKRNLEAGHLSVFPAPVDGDTLDMENVKRDIGNT